MKKKRKKEKKYKKNPRNQNPCHPLFSGGIICGSHRGSFAVRDHLRSNLGIISGLGIICGRGSFAALYLLQITLSSLPPNRYTVKRVGKYQGAVDLKKVHDVLAMQVYQLFC